jgi:hypothetical protein
VGLMPARERNELRAAAHNCLYSWLPIMLSGGWSVFVLPLDRRVVVVECCA